MRLLTKTSLIALAAVAASSPAFASDTQYWQTLQGSVKVADKTSVSDELVLRSSDAKGFYEIENVLMLNYKPAKNVTIGAAWVFNPLYSHGTFTTTENRARQQVTVDNIATIGKAKLSARMRIEERWRDGFSGTAWRLRPYVKLSIPVHGKTVLNLTSEPFIDLNTNTFQKVGGLERMRNAILINTPLVKHVNLEVGYLNQHGFVRGGPDTSDNVVMTGISASF